MATEDQEFVVVDENDVQDFNPEGVLPLSEEDFSRIRAWLAPTDYAAVSSEWRKHRASHLAGTGAWILNTDQYQQWHNSDHGGLWIKAVAGVGKSVAAATIVSNLAAEEKHPVLYFFFRHIISANQTPKSLVRDFLAQVLQYSPKLQRDIFKLVDTDQRTLQNVSLTELWDLLVSTLIQLPRVYCIIDALDEMDVEGEDFLDEIVSLAQKQPTSLKVLITSRPIPRVERHLRNTDVLQLALQPQLVNPDISVYVRYRVNEHEMPHKMRSHIHSIMCRKADGHFLYARLMMDDLLDAAKNILSDEQKLFVTLNELPTPMADMYTQMLLEHSRRSQVPQGLQVAILQWITRAERPLRLLELSTLVDIKRFMPGAQKDAKSIIREACGPLLEIFEDETVHPIHHSFTEYLYDQSRIGPSSDTSSFPVLEYEIAQCSLAITCLQQLASGWHTEWLTPMPESDGNGAHRDKLGDRNALRLKYPWLDYAAKNWSCHVRKSRSRDDGIMTALSKVFTRDSDLLCAWLNWQVEKRYPFHDPDTDENLRFWSPLHAAADKGVVQFVERLLRDGYEVNQLTSTESTPLLLAARNGHHEVVQALLEYGAKNNEPDNFGLKPLHHAARANHQEVVRLLLEAGVDPYTGKTKENPGRRCGNAARTTGDSPVQYACSSGNTKTMKVMIPFLKGESLQQALYWALLFGQTEIATAILQCPDIDVNYYFRNHTPLYLASRVRDLTVMRLLLDKGADAKLLSSDQVHHGGTKFSLYWHNECASPLHAFAGNHHRHGSWQTRDAKKVNMTKGFVMLLEAGIDPNITDANGSTILHAIVERGIAHQSTEPRDKSDIAPTLALLFERGLSPKSMTRDGSNALHLARGVTPNVVDLLLDHGVNIDAARDSDGKTPLMTAIARFDTVAAQHFLQRKANVRIADHDGNTPLHLVGQLYESQVDLDLVRDLIAAGADIDSRNIHGNTALHTGEPKLGLTKLFMQHDFNLESKNRLGQTLLFQTLSRWNHNQPERRLVELGSDPLTTDNQGRTVLHVLVGKIESGNKTSDMIRYFVEKGVDPQSCDIQGNNLWHVMASVRASNQQNEQLAVMKLLMEYGVSPVAKNLAGQTPLHIAFSVERNQNHPGFIDFVLEHTEVDFNTADYDHVRPLHLSASFDPKSTCFLLEHGADCTVTTKEGQTPLMVACRTRQSNIVCILLDHYRKNNLSHMVDQKDKVGQTALHLACQSGRPETVALLLEAGADANSKTKLNATPLHSCATFLEEDASWQKSAPFLGGETNTMYKANYVLSTDSPVLDRFSRGRTRDPIRVRETIRLLIEYGADVSFLTDKGGRGPHIGYGAYIPHDPGDPLSVAITKGCGPMVSELLLIQKRLLRKGGVEEPEPKIEGKPGTAVLSPDAQIPMVMPDEVNGFHNKMRLLKLLYTPKVIASSIDIGENNIELVRDLLIDDDEPGIKQISNLGARFDRFEHTNGNVLHALATCGYADLLCELYDHTARTTIVSHKEITAHHKPQLANNEPSLLSTALARSTVNLAVIKVLVSKLKTDVNERFAMRSHESLTLTHAHQLARPYNWWQTKALAYLLENGASVDIVNSDGETPLIVALREGYNNEYDPVRVRAVEVLLEHGADPNSTDKNGLTCLNIAARQPKCVKALLKYGADPSHGIRSFLLDAVEAQDIDTIRYIIASGTDVNLRSQLMPEHTHQNRAPRSIFQGSFSSISRDNVEKWCRVSSLRDLSAHAYVIHVAASKFFKSPEKLGRACEIITLLLDGGADPFLTYEDGSSILHCLTRNEGIIEPFICLPTFDTELRDGKGRTLLLAACRSLTTEYVEQQRLLKNNGTIDTLIKLGASITATDNKGCNGLHHLVETIPLGRDFGTREHQKILQPFLSSSLLRTDLKGRTPYHYALLRHHIGLAQLLLANGADFSTPDPTDDTTTLHHLVPQLVNEDDYTCYEIDNLIERRSTSTNTAASSTNGISLKIARCLEEASSEELAKARERSARRLFLSLVARGLNINHRDARGETPLFKLADTGAQKAKWVNEEEVESGTGTGTGTGILLYAFQTMEKAGANLKLRSHTGESVLHKLATRYVDEYSHQILYGGSQQCLTKDLEESFKWLVGKGVDVAWEDNEQRTCLDVAAASGATWMTKLYERSGALVVR